MRFASAILLAVALAPAPIAAQTRLFILMSESDIPCPAAGCPQGWIFDLDVAAGALLAATPVPYAKPAGGDLGISLDGRYLLWSGSNVPGHATFAAYFDTVTRASSLVTAHARGRRLLVHPSSLRAFIDDLTGIVVAEPAGVQTRPVVCPGHRLVDMSRDGARLLVACGVTTTLHVLDSASGAIAAPVPEPPGAEGSGPLSVVLGPTGTEVYRASVGPIVEPADARVTRREVGTGTVLDSYSAGDRMPTYLHAVDPRTTRLFAYRPGSIHVFTTAPLGALATIPGPSPFASPRMLLDPDAPRLFVAWTAPGPTPAGALFRVWLQVIDTETLAVTTIGEISTPLSATALAIGPTPAAPTGLAATVTHRRVSLQWTAGAGKPATGFIVEAGSGPGLSNLAQMSVTGTTLGVDDVPPGTYYVRVRPMNALGRGPVSNEIVVTVP